MNPNEAIEAQKGSEQRETRPPESQKEQEQTVYQGAEMLEEPQDGSFTLGLQAFIAWVKSLVASNDKS